MAAPVIQFKRGLFANLPGLQAGEPALTTDTFELYVGIDSTTNNNKFFGSHRYWTKNTTTTGSGVNLVEGSSNGSDFITLKAPDTLAGITTYTFPASPTDGFFLKTNSTGTLAWEAVVSEFTIAADIGTEDTVSTGSTITFAGTANEIETAVTNNQIQIGLPNNVIVGGALTVSGNTTLGDNGSDLITVVGVTTFTTSNVFIDNQLFVGGLQITGGSLVGEDITTRNLSVSGITTLGTGVGVTQFSGSVSTGTSTSSVPTSSAVIDYVDAEIGDIDLEIGLAADSGTASTFNTSQTLTVSGTANEIETAVSGQTITIGLPNNVIVGGALTVTNATSSNNFIATTTTLQAPTIGNYAGERVRLYDFDDPTNTNYAIGVETSHIWFGVDNYGDGQGFKWYGEETQVARLGGTGNLTLEGNLRVNGTGISTFAGLIDGNGGLDISGQSTLGNLSVSGITTLGTGVGVTQFSSSVSTGTSTSSVPTSSAVLDYIGTQIGNIDLTLGINADTGGPSTVATSQTLTVSGTANEVNTSVSGQTITVGLPDTINITTLLDVPTVEASNLKARDGTTAITIADSTGNVATNSDLTVGGNLYVNGSTTQVNSTALTVEDRTIDLGIVNGAAPAGTTTWDLGILFNYNSSGAKKSAVIWEHADSRFKFASVLGADTDGTDVDTPQLTVTTFAPIEIGQLWVTDCAGTSQVISCTGSTRNLENITIDAGTF
jgi:hypothetical protein